MKISQPVIRYLDGTIAKTPPLSKSFSRSQYLLTTAISNLFRRHTETHLLFITLTFPEPLKSTHEAQRRLNSFLNKIRSRYTEYLWVLQPHQSGAIHFHVLVPVLFDTHTGTRLNAWEDREFFNDNDRLLFMNPQLRVEADWWTLKAPGFQFGRVEVAPVYSNGEAVGKYLSTQNWRSDDWPFEETKNFRFWGCSRSARAGSVRFSWNTAGGRKYREELRIFALENGCHSYEDLYRKLGPNWGWLFLYTRALQALVFPFDASGSLPSTSA